MKRGFLKASKMRFLKFSDELKLFFSKSSVDVLVRFTTKRNGKGQYRKHTQFKRPRTTSNDLERYTIEAAKLKEAEMLLKAF